MRPIFCGNFEFDASQSDLERLFKRYGKVDRVQMKSGFAFVYMDDERDAEDAIRALDRTEFGRKGRRLSVEWTKHERSAKKPVSSSRRPVNLRPSKTLFVINFPYHTRTRDLEKHFDPFGKIVNVRIRRNFAFVQFECLEDATKALDATNMSKMMERVISVEYAAREDAEGRNGHSPDKRGRGRSPGRGRPPSHSSRERGSPDYGHGRSPLAHRRERASPDYGRERDRSPGHKGRSSPDYGRERSRSPHRASPDYGREHNYSPLGRGRRSANNGHERSHSPHGGVRGGTNHGRSPSPPQRQSVSPIYREHERSSHEKRHERSSQEKRIRNGYRRRGNSSPYQKEKASPDHDRPHSPKGITDRRDSPVGCHESPVDDRRGSLSPLPRDGSRS